MLSPALTTAKQLRIPTFEKGTSPRMKIDELETYLLLGAHTQGDLSEERLDLLVKLKPLQNQWEHLDGWESLKQTRTEAGVKDAKRRINPDLYDQIQDLEWMVKRLTEEIDRLERDATKVSRVYTMITGS